MKCTRNNCNSPMAKTGRAGDTYHMCFICGNIKLPGIETEMKFTKKDFKSRELSNDSINIAARERMALKRVGTPHRKNGRPKK